MFVLPGHTYIVYTTHFVKINLKKAYLPDVSHVAMGHWTGI